MINSILPKFLFDEEDIIYLKDKGIQIQEGSQVISSYKIPCFKFYNLNECEVFDTLEHNRLYEANTESEIVSYATRVAAVLFLRIRQVASIKDKDQKIAAACSLLSAVNSLASLSTKYALRFIPLVRSLV